MKKMDEKKEIINRINKIAGKYSPYEVFTDWIRCSALAMSNTATALHGKIWHAPEGYNDITDMVDAWRPLPEPYRPERSSCDEKS